MRNQHYHVIIVTIHTAHALQDNVVGIDNRHIKTEKFVHGIMGDRRRRAEPKERNLLGLGQQINGAIHRRHIQRLANLIQRRHR
ncbi:hypothetical protein D3C75_778610 [compost metagenome]